MPSEKTIQTAGLKFLRSQTGGVWFKIHDLLTSGIPDVIGCYYGKFIAVEFKAPGKKPNPLQKYILEQINRFGGIGIYCDDVKELKKQFKQWGNFNATVPNTNDASGSDKHI